MRKLLEPRDQLIDALVRKQQLKVNVGAVGPQWLAHTLGDHDFTGRLDANDGFAEYHLYFERGRPVHATAIAGRFTAEGERAFNAFVATSSAEGTLFFGDFPAPGTLHLPLADLLGRARDLLNDNERRAREGLMVSANEIEVNADLYAVYRMVGPKQ